MIHYSLTAERSLYKICRNPSNLSWDHRFNLNVTTWSVKFYLKGVSSVGEGIPSLRHDQSVPTQCVGGRLLVTLSAVGGILKLQGGKESPYFTVCGCVCLWASNGSWTEGLRSQVHALYYTHTCSFSLTLQCSRTLFSSYAQIIILVMIHPSNIVCQVTDTNDHGARWGC